jgi:MHS family shikimate/dehydroshikimate transporter-like MFS transporter
MSDSIAGNLPGAAITKAPSTRQVAMISLVGTTIEWYDFQVYGLAASLVFGALFFPSFDPVAGTLLSFATFGVGFIARPFGSIIFGHLGDRLGRRRILMVSLIMMGSATFLIGCLPTFGQIGVWAPILLVLLRLLQGLGLGGEWGGAAVYAVESAPAGRRARYGGLPQMGSPLGLLIATTVFTLIELMPEDALNSWGWRIPFWVSAALIVVGIYLRRNLEDTPAFTKARDEKRLVRFPLGHVLKTYPKELLITFGMFSATSGGFYMFVTFIPAYGKSTLHVAPAILSAGLFIFAAAEFLAVLGGTALADRFGRRPPFIITGIITILAAWPLYALVETGNPVGILGVLLVGGIVIGVMFGIPGSLAPEQFPAEVRYSGAGLGYQVSAAIVGGLTPVVTTAAANAAQSTWPVALLLGFFVLVGVIAVAVSRETRTGALRETGSIATQPDAAAAARPAAEARPTVGSTASERSDR